MRVNRLTINVLTLCVYERPDLPGYWQQRFQETRKCDNANQAEVCSLVFSVSVLSFISVLIGRGGNISSTNLASIFPVHHRGTVVVFQMLCLPIKRYWCWGIDLWLGFNSASVLTTEIRRTERTRRLKAECSVLIIGSLKQPQLMSARLQPALRLFLKPPTRPTRHQQLHRHLYVNI